MKRVLLLTLLLMLGAASSAYTATMTPSCTKCNINEDVNFTVTVSPSITTTYDVTAYVAEFVPPSITVVRGANVSWRFIDNAPYNHVVHVADDGGAWQTGDMTHNSVNTYVFNTLGFYSYRLQPPIEGAPSTTTGNLTVEERPALSFTPPSSPFSISLNGSGSTYTTSVFLSDSSPKGIWGIDFNYTDSKNGSVKISSTINVTSNLLVNATPPIQIKQEEDITIPITVRRASGNALLSGESANVTCTDLTQGQTNTTVSTGSTATCKFANLTTFGRHTVSVTASFRGNSETTLVYYNVTYYYATTLSVDSSLKKYNLGTTANMTASITPNTGVSGSGTFTVMEPGSPPSTYPVSGTASFAQVHTFGTSEGQANLSFDFTDALGRRAHQDTSVALTRNLTISASFPQLRQEGNMTLNITVTDVNNRPLAGAAVTYADLNETMNCAPATDVNGFASCAFNGINNFGWHNTRITASRGSNYGNTTQQFFVDGFYPTTLNFRMGGNQISMVNLKEFFDISAIPTQPGTGAFLDGINPNGTLTNAMNCVPTYTPSAGEYFWRACDGGSTTGPRLITFRYTAPDGHVAHASRNITVSPLFSLSVSPETAEFVSGQSSTIIVVVRDINGRGIGGANVTCSEGSTRLNNPFTDDAGAAICSFSLPTGTHTINITAGKDYNSGSMLASYVFSPSGSSKGPSTIIIPPEMVFSDYPASFNMTAGRNATVIFTVWNKGKELSKYNRIKLGTISQGWYTSPNIEVYAGEKKNIIIDLKVPPDATTGDYNSTVTLVGSLCGSKVVYPNGTYYYTGGDCETKPFKLTIRTELQTIVAETKENITITSDKQNELAALISEMNKLGVDPSAAQASLESGNKEIEDAKKLLNATDVSGAKQLVEKANAGYDAAIAKARLDLRGSVDPLIAAVESKLDSITNVSASELDLVDNARGLLSDARMDYAAGNYSSAKTKLNSAYALIKDIKPAATQEAEPPAESKLPLSYAQIGIILLLASLIAVSVAKRDLLKSKLGPLFDPMRGRKELITKYVWPDKITAQAESTLTVSISIKNSFAAPITNLEILDLMPLGFNLVEGSFNTGATEMPVELGKTLQGSAFRWKLPELQPGKSVNITYKASVMPLGDQIKLPAAGLKYTDRKGAEVKQRSGMPAVEITA